MSADRSSPLVPLVHVPAYLGLSVVWVLVISLVTALVVALGGGLEGGPDLEVAMEQALGAGGMGLLSMVQILGLATCAVVLAAVLPRSGDAVFALPGPDLASNLRAHLALRRTPAVVLLVAGLGALTVWTLPSWLAEQLLPLLPEGSSSSLELLTHLLETAAPTGKFILLSAIVVSAPVFEEVIFRGYLWAAISCAAPEWVAFGVTTVLFAMYHLDPVHIVSLLPTALFLGWLRWRSGSLWPSILAHFVNNAIAAVVTLLPGAQDADALPLTLALGGAAFTTVCAAAVWAWTRQPPNQEIQP